MRARAASIGALVVALIAIPTTAVAAPMPAVSVTDNSPANLGGAALRGDDWLTLRADPANTYTATGALEPATAAAARADQPAYYHDEDLTGAREGCHHGRTDPIAMFEACVYGDPTSETDVYVIGSSKTGQWFDSFERIAEREDWALHAMTRSACAFTPGMDTSGYPQCREWNDFVLAEIQADPPEMVLLAPYFHSANPYTPADQQRIVQQLLDAGVDRVLIIWDSPSPSGGPNECIGAGPADFRDCAFSFPAGSGTQSLNHAAADLAATNEHVTYLDMEPWVCPDSSACAAVIGGVQVMGSGSHLTVTYTRSLTNVIHAQLAAAGVAVRDPLDVQRLAGANRYSTAVEVAEASGHDGFVYLASGLNYPDALAASSQGDAPVLLTAPHAMPQQTADYFASLAAGTEVVIVGEEDVVSAAVASRLEQLGLTITRVGAASRYGTAARLAAMRADVPSIAYLAVGTNWPDAAAAAAYGPVLLTTTAQLHPRAAETLALWVEGGLEQVVIVGDSGVVSSAVLSEVQSLGVDVERIAGTTRYTTALALAQAAPAPLASPVFVSGEEWVDAVIGAQLDGALLLVPQHALPASLDAWLAGGEVSEPVIVGGDSRVSPLVEVRIADFLAPSST